MKQKKNLREGTLGIILSFVMVLGLMPGMSMTAWADGQTELTADTLSWNGEYTVNTDVTINGKVEVMADTTLNIPSGITVTLDGHQISDTVGYTLTVTGGGTLSVTGGQAEKTALSGVAGSNLIVDNATVIATGFSDVNGNSGDAIFEYGSIILETGTLTAIGGTGYNRGRGITGCNTLTVNGGTLNATGGNSTYRYNSGGLAIGSISMTINGGTVNVKGGDGNRLGGSGIQADLIINGGTVTADGGNGNTNNGGDGIIGKDYTVTINGGTVTLNGGASGSEEKYGKGVNNSTILILGSGVSMLSSADNVNWIPYDGSTRTRYMKTGSLEKPAAEVTAAPTAKTNLVANGNAQQLVTAGIASGGTMQYAIGRDATTAPTDGWNTSVPIRTDAGTYYVWYKAVGDENHTDSEVACVTVSIRAEISATVTFKVENGFWNEGEGEDAAADRIVTLTGFEGDDLKLTADLIPSVGSRPDEGFKEGGWDAEPGTETVITENVVYTYTYAPEEKESPAFKTYSVTLGADLGLNFYINLPETEGVSYDYMDFSVKGEKIGRKAFDANGSKNGKGYYKFTADLNVTQMAEEVTAVLHYREGGEEKTLSDERSIKDYVEAFEEARQQYPDNQALAKAEEMVYSMADYGHYTQVYLAEQRHWSYGVDHAAMDKFFSNPYSDQQISGAVNAIKNGYGLKNKALTEDIAGLGMSLTLDSRTTFNLYITPTEGYTGTVSSKVEGMKVRVRKLNDGRYQISVLDIAASQLGKDLDFVITTDAGDSTFKASALYYAYLALGDDSDSVDAETKDAMVSIYRYYKAADDYVKG